MIGRSAMSIKATQVTNAVNIGWGGGAFSNYGNSVDRSGPLEWSVYRASVLGNNILYFRSQRGVPECQYTCVCVCGCVCVCVCGGGYWVFTTVTR